MRDYPFYVYLHTNGELITKNPWVVDSMGASEYFDSSFVVKYWLVKNDEELEGVKKQAVKLIK